MSDRARLGLVAAAVAVLIAGFVLASRTSEDADAPGAGSAPATTATLTAPANERPTTPEVATAPERQLVPRIKTVVVRGGKPVGGVQRLSFAKGGRVRFKVRSDVADEIHVHGYDLMRDVKEGGTLSFSFPATIDGRFEVELENHGEQIAQLEVTP